jgi:hypothetical protein
MSGGLIAMAHVLSAVEKGPILTRGRARTSPSRVGAEPTWGAPPRRRNARRDRGPLPVWRGTPAYGPNPYLEGLTRGVARRKRAATSVRPGFATCQGSTDYLRAARFLAASRRSVRPAGKVTMGSVAGAWA